MDPLGVDGHSKKINKPKVSKFTQRELPACKPVLTPRIVVAAFSLIGIIFIPIGLGALSASRGVVELVGRYDISCVHTHDKIAFIQNPNVKRTCSIKLNVPKYMKSPILVYYQIGNFYQNHRRCMLKVEATNNCGIRML